MQEIWKEVKALTGIEVSNFGNVRSWRCKGKPCNIRADKSHLLSQKDNGHGYKCINIRENGKSIHLYVHRIVAEAFIPNPNNFPQINHKDECKSNNHCDNLEWCTSAYNHQYGTINQRISEKMKKRTGALNHMFGKHLSEEAKEKIRLAHLGTHASIETKKKLSEQRKGTGNPFFGKTHSEETKRKISESNTGKYSGKNNPMFGKSAYANKTEDEIKEINRKKSESLKAFYKNKTTKGE